jgi:hypothetical protein
VDYLMARLRTKSLPGQVVLCMTDLTERFSITSYGWRDNVHWISSDFLPGTQNPYLPKDVFGVPGRIKLPMYTAL